MGTTDVAHLSAAAAARRRAAAAGGEAGGGGGEGSGGRLARETTRRSLLSSPRFVFQYVFPASLDDKEDVSLTNLAASLLILRLS